MVLKRQLPSRVAPDAASTPPDQTVAPATPNIEAEWPAPPAATPGQPVETPAAAAPEAPAETPPAVLPPLPALPPLPELPPLEAAPQPAPQPVTEPVVVQSSAQGFSQSVSEPTEQPVAAPAVETAPAAPAASADATPSLPSGDTPRRRVKAPRAFEQSAPTEAAPAPAPVDSPVAETPERLASAGIIESKPADPLTASLPPAPPTAPAEPENIFAMPLPPVQPAAAPVAPSPAAAAAPLAEPASDLPWAATAETKTTDSGWDIDTPAAPPTITATPAPAASAPPPDVFRDVAVSRAPEGPMPSMPWSTPGNGRPAPELPGNSISSTPRGGSFQMLLAAVVVAGVIFAAYYIVSNSGSGRTQEQLARLTGSLREAPEVAPGSPSSTNPAVQPNLQPEKVIAMNGMSGTILPPPAVANANNTFQPLQPATPVSGNVVVDFADVPPGEAGKPIVADGTEKMPADVGFVASLQQAIAKEKAKTGGQPAAIQQAEAEKAADKNLTQEQKLKRGEDLKAQLDDELAAYRKALAEAPAPALAPKPTDFFNNSKPFMDGKAAAAVTASGTLLLPPAATPGASAAASAKQGVEGLPPAALYANNPKNLPVLAEPAAAEAPKIRQLSDFNVNVFAPEEPRVRMPQGVKPQIAAGDFPALDILSLVPGRGLIAYYEGKEGVLLLGEKVAGWRLVGVNGSTAEFASGEKRQTVRPD